jgi:two-component system sensor histidine kinase YesM
MRHYMTIIENRLQGRVSAEVNVAPEWLDVVLPKMTIQPIIENAVKYGLEPLSHKGDLRVSTKVNEQELWIVIEDNGIGMEEGVLNRLREMLREDTASIHNPASYRKNSRGIGLTNVHRRIALMFGDSYGLSIHSIQGEGTTVTIAIPLPRKGS